MRLSNRVLENSTKGDGLATQGALRCLDVTSRTIELFAVALIVDDEKVFSWAFCPIGTPPIHVLIQLRHIDRGDSALAKEWDHVAIQHGPIRNRLGMLLRGGLGGLLRTRYVLAC